MKFMFLLFAGWVLCLTSPALAHDWRVDPFKNKFGLGCGAGIEVGSRKILLIMAQDKPKQALIRVAVVGKEFRKIRKKLIPVRMFLGDKNWPNARFINTGKMIYVDLPFDLSGPNNGSEGELFMEAFDLAVRKPSFLMLEVNGENPPTTVEMGDFPADQWMDCWDFVNQVEVKK